MKIRAKRLIRDEKGYTLVLVLVVLLLGSLIIAPLLAYMSTGLMTGLVFERKTNELYAADAGVELGIWKIMNDQIPNPTEQPYFLTVNDKDVEVTIEFIDSKTYKIISTATTDNNSSTTVESYVNITSFLDNAITTMGNVSIQPNSHVDGDVQYGGDPEDNQIQIVVSGEVKREEFPKWPSFEQISSYYWDDVKHLAPTIDGVINISGTTEDNPHVIGPLSAAGGLTIKGSSWIMLGGTIHVKGDLVFNPTPEMNVHLNQQTIFVEGGIKILPGSGSGLTLTGSGCIIAINDVTLLPSIETGPGNDDFVFIMSVEGRVRLQPLGKFSGSVAGNEKVELIRHSALTWQPIPEGVVLNFPIKEFETLLIRTWKIY